MASIRVVDRIADQSDFVAGSNTATGQAMVWDQTAAKFRAAISGAVSVKAFGAVGDGATNDQAAFDLAEAAALAEGGTRHVYVPAGTYLVDTIHFYKNYTLSGDGPNATNIASSGGNAPVLYSTEMQNTTLRDFTVIGANDTALTLEDGIRWDGQADDQLAPRGLCIERVRVKDVGGYGIAIGNSDDPLSLDGLNTCWSSSIRDVVVDNPGKSALFFQIAGPSVKIDQFTYLRIPNTSGDSGTNPNTADGRWYGLEVHAGQVMLDTPNGQDNGPDDGAGGGAFYLGASVWAYVVNGNFEQYDGAAIYCPSDIQLTVVNCTWKAEGAGKTNLIPIYANATNGGIVIINSRVFFGSETYSHNLQIHCNYGVPIHVINKAIGTTEWDNFWSINESTSHAVSSIGAVSLGTVTGANDLATRVGNLWATKTYVPKDAWSIISTDNVNRNYFVSSAQTIYGGGSDSGVQHQFVRHDGTGLLNINADASLSGCSWAGSTIGVAKGGTGVTTFGGTNRLLYTTSTDTLSSIATANSATLITSSGGVPSWSTNQRIERVGISIDGGGSVLATGLQRARAVVPFGMTITKATLIGNESGSIVIDVLKSTYSGFPTTSSICASAKPTLSSAQKSQDSTLTGWTTSVSAGDVLEFNINSVTSITGVTLLLEGART